MLPPKLFELFIAPLNTLDIRYMVTGGIASIIYGEPRLTVDIDIVITMSESDISRFHRAFEKEALYVPPVEVLMIEAGRRHYGHFNLIDTNSALRADVYLTGKDAFMKWALENRRKINIHNEDIWVAPPEYVIVQKMQYMHDGGSSKHADDIRAILKMLQKDLNYDVILREISSRNLRKEWEIVNIQS